MNGIDGSSAWPRSRSQKAAARRHVDALRLQEDYLLAKIAGGNLYAVKEQLFRSIISGLRAGIVAIREKHDIKEG